MATAKKTRTGRRRWVGKVKTDSTHPPEGLFTKDAETIARTLASKKVSPKGPGSGMRMLIYFINRGGRGLTPKRRAELERAKKLLSKRIHREESSLVQRQGLSLTAANLTFVVDNWAQLVSDLAVHMRAALHKNEIH